MSRRNHTACFYLFFFAFNILVGGCKSIQENIYYVFTMCHVPFWEFRPRRWVTRQLYLQGTYRIDIDSMGHDYESHCECPQSRTGRNMHTCMYLCGFKLMILACCSLKLFLLIPFVINLSITKILASEASLISGTEKSIFSSHQLSTHSLILTFCPQISRLGYLLHFLCSFSPLLIHLSQHMFPSLEL